MFVNVAGLHEAAYIAALEEMKQELLRDRPAPPVLIDLTNVQWTTGTVNKAKVLGGDLKGAGVQFGPIAMTGLTKLQKSVADLSVKTMYCAVNIDEAKEQNKRR